MSKYLSVDADGNRLDVIGSKAPIFGIFDPVLDERAVCVRVQTVT